MRKIGKVIALLGALVCACGVVSAQRPQKKDLAAREQYEAAIGLRTELESEPQAARTLAAYKEAVAAYKKVYPLSPQAEEVTPSLVAAAELYREMGQIYDEAYFKSAIDTYNFLVKQYPHSRYAAASLFAIGKIQQEDLNDATAAEATFKDCLRRFPKSAKADEVRDALNQLAQADNARQAASQSQSSDQQAGTSARMDPKEGGEEGSVARVTGVRTWNADDYTRIVVDLGSTVKFQAGRIKKPDRIFFDLYQARLGPDLAGKTLDVQNGFLKAVRMAQNKAGVVRLVLDVDSVKEYSAFLLQNPYRLVIDVHGQTLNASKRDAVASGKNADIKSATPSASIEPAEKVTVSADDSAPKPMDHLPIRPNAHGHDASTLSPAPSKPTRDGQRSLTRALGLKISRIVIDPGHGGHDTGTIGPHGLMEKDLCLDVALRLGKLIQDKLPGAEVLYTRKDDTFIPLEERTAIANQSKADLFISIHANSSHDKDARGVETYYLNFAASQDALDVAARENALSQTSLHDLQNMIQKIARNEKIEESRELAGNIQDSLAKRMQQISHSERNRGVKKAPFVVLIGANMPSVLSEISFLSNAADEKMLKKADQRQRVADGLFRGVSSYLESLNSLSYNQQRPSPSRQGSPLDSDGNPK